MKKSDWKCKIGGDAFAFVPLSVVLVVFGGITAWLYIKDNGAFIFTALFTALFFAIAIYSVYRYFFVKILIDENGFYHQSGIGNGNYYKYTDIAEMWVSEGRTQNGAVNYCLNYRTVDGKTVKFPFVMSQYDNVEYLLMQFNGEEESDEE